VISRKPWPWLLAIRGEPARSMAGSRCLPPNRRGAAMTVFLEPFASVYDDRSRLGIILARGRGGFEAYSADDHSLGLFPSPRKAAAAITTTRTWVAHGQSSGWPISLDSIANPPRATMWWWLDLDYA
jgi:hypothetical protein